MRFLRNMIVASALLLTASSLPAQQTKTIEHGRTKVALASSFVWDLQSAGVAPGVVDPTQLKDGVVDFPVIGGALDLDSGLGQILHSGGLTLTAGGKTVRLQSFIIDTSDGAVITGLVDVNGTLLGRLPLFKLHPPAGVKPPYREEDGKLRLKNVNVTLTKKAADALNGVFGVTIFHENYEIGTASVRINFQEACKWDCD